MFIGFSRTLKKMGGFRLGVGLRLTKKNALWFFFSMFFVLMAQIMWYTIVGAGWLVYGLCLAIGLLCRSIYRAIKGNRSGEAIR